MHYVAPSPTWRVSYRVVAETDEDGSTGKALLQGWGLFDNRLEEDLDDVQVTLVAGQPISFIYELYASRIPERPIVQDETRIAPGPIEFDGAVRQYNAESIPMMGAAELDGTATLSKKGRTRYVGGMGDVSEEKHFSTLGEIGDMRLAAPAQATGKEAGEFFQYIVNTPVSVKRGESALVPIIGADINYNCELLYNGRKLPKHPVAAMRFDNTTGLTLERGPVTVVEDNDYRGEAVVPFTKDGNEVYLPYAVELGIQITENPNIYTKVVGIEIEGAYIKFDSYNISQLTYTIENKTHKNHTVIIEAPITQNYQLVDTAIPDVETATDYRWKVNTPATSKIKFEKTERRRTASHTEIRKLSYKNLENYLKNKWLDQALFDELSGILDMLDEIRRMNHQRELLEAERGKTYISQEQLRANLQTLQPTGQEANLRNRMLQQLEASQNRLEEIENTLKELVQLEADVEKRIEETIAALGGQ